MAVLRTYDALVHLGLNVWSTETWVQLLRLKLVSEEVIPARCERGGDGAIRGPWELHTAYWDPTWRLPTKMLKHWCKIERRCLSE
jgi:hypothetical protein